MTPFEPNRRTEYDRDSIIAEVRRVVTKHFGGSVPKMRDFEKFARVHLQTVKRQFGSWAAAMKAAGFEGYFKSPVGKKDLIRDLRSVLDRAGGKYFSQPFYDKHGHHSIKTLKSRFGYKTWREMLHRVLDVRPSRQVVIRAATPRKAPTEAELLAELKRVWELLGRRPKYTEFRQHSQFGTKSYERTFGSWRAAIGRVAIPHASSLKGTPGTHSTREMLLAELKAISPQVPNGILPFALYRRLGGTYSIVTFQKAFGRWAKAVQTIGLTAGRFGALPGLRHYSDEDYFQEIQRLWEQFGRQPTSREMRQHGEISPQSFQMRFGSWMKAIHAFCADRTMPVSSPSRAELTEGTAPRVEHQLAKNTYSGEAPTQTTLGEVVPNVMAPADKAGPDREELTTPGEVVRIVMTTPRSPGSRLRFRVFQRDKFTCVACGRKPPEVILEPDHIKPYLPGNPYSPGGETVFENLQTLCRDCNRGKSNSEFV